MVIPRTADNNAGSLNEWTAAEYDKMMRIDRDKGILYSGDIIKFGINKELVTGLISSIYASYTKKEAELLLRNSNLSEYTITSNPFSIFIKGKKNNL